MSKPLLLPKSDMIFKLIFGDQKNAEILEGFLKATLDLPPDDYGQLTITDSHLNRETKAGKMSILDVKLQTRLGKVIDIEIQLSDLPDIRTRIIYYVARMITGQMKKSQD
ncbi:MAG: Rpn family recombination-promoting nuclease/putative transposase, partial [Candidatus Adiutrix sp.]|nr:Rpn family recombination-promoting nuclease/putative transposase [Candidatus Adiutrix sp.]